MPGPPEGLQPGEPRRPEVASLQAPERPSRALPAPEASSLPEVRPGAVARSPEAGQPEPGERPEARRKVPGPERDNLQAGRRRPEPRHLGEPGAHR